MSAALVMAGVRKAYGDRVALDGVDLTVEPGDVLGLLGINGAGKTTLVSIVAGLRRPDAGTVHVCGIDVAADPRAARRRLGLAPQELGICPLLTVRENMRLFGELVGLRRRELAARVGEVSDGLDLGAVLDRPVRFLSSGEQRRAHTALALMGRPALVILDEPTAGVDIHARADVLEYVRELADDGIAVVYSTHYLHEVEELDASVAILDGGRVIARGAVGDLVGEHAEPMVELAFEGPPPSLAIAARTAVAGNTLRAYGDRPAALAAAAVGLLGADAERLRSVEIVRPTLESAFLSLTGRRWSHA
jgi:ABC-2 type transport system ATP-binding protein